MATSQGGAISIAGGANIYSPIKIVTITERGRNRGLFSVQQYMVINHPPAKLESSITVLELKTPSFFAHFLQ